MEKIQAVINADGSYTCEVNISMEEWKAVLSATQITPKAKEALLAFYAMPDYKASCMEVSRAVYGDDKHYRNINAAVVQFGRAARSILNRIEIVGEGAAWLFPMDGGKRSIICLYGRCGRSLRLLSKPRSCRTRQPWRLP
ncbi:hypothetical protein [Prevotella dentasini]|uniref:hypothetical protein n=1 Tax=Prevotella dentasini TaxID=589537 RepID=UPI000687F3B7|nr:hypothetical protein [Prevotella dentasini]